MLVTLDGIVTDVRPLQPPNVPTPMLVTPLPIVTLVKLVQLENTEPKMLSTLFGIVTYVRPLQPRNVPYPMLVTLVPISTV